MFLNDTTRKNISEQNECDAPFDFAAFVAGHKAMMDYLSKFGSPVEQAKVAILYELAGVES